MSLRKKILILILICLMVLLVLLIIFGINVTNNQNEQIKSAALKWYYDTDMLYGKVTIGKLYDDGYLDTDKSKLLNRDIRCRVVLVEDDVVKVTRDDDCDYNDSLSNLPKVEIKLYKKDSDSEYIEPEWTSSDVIVKPQYGNNFDQSLIEKVYITSNYDVIFEDALITTNSVLEGNYEFNVLLKDGSLIKKEFRVMIDKTAPVFVSKNMTDNDFEAIFEDEDSEIQKVLYYVTNEESRPTSLIDFKTKEEIKLLYDEKYYIYAAGVNWADVSSDIVYLGEFTKIRDDRDNSD